MGHFNTIFYEEILSKRSVMISEIINLLNTIYGEVSYDIVLLIYFL